MLPLATLYEAIESAIHGPGVKFGEDELRMTSQAKTQAAPRFAFGRNWERFLRVVDEERIQEAEKSLREYLQCGDLAGKRFLDIGSGSGLFSLAARRLGASVLSFDYDSASVACTEEMRRRYCPNDPNWTVTYGSVLDQDFLASLGKFDVVYAWGVLHHTGEMWKALEHAALPLRPGGKLYIAIYNYQRPWTAWWTGVKWAYNRLPRILHVPFAIMVMTPIEIRALVYSIVTLKPVNFVRRWTRYQSVRGMSRWHDVIDWVGGYPFETAKPEQVFEYYRTRGFVLQKLFTCGGAPGCNQFVFERVNSA